MVQNIKLGKIGPAHFNGLEKTQLEPKFEVSSSKNKNLAQQCNLQKIWKILLLLISKKILQFRPFSMKTKLNNEENLYSKKSIFWCLYLNQTVLTDLSERLKKRFNQYTFANTNLRTNDHESYQHVFLVQKSKSL